ncbi:tolloid-like protein 2 [Oculina patagonica]
MSVIFLLVMFMCSGKYTALAIQECGSVVNNTLTSPGYPNNYPNNLDCNYSVPIPHGMAMKIYFHELNVEYHPTCNYDYLKITSENSETFGAICGYRYGTDIIVTGNYALLTFHSDSEVQNKGFNISFSVVLKPEIIECGSVVNNTLKSPGYPDNYPPNMDCNYSVSIPHGKAITITFHEFDVEYDRDCEYDYLKITNENNKEFGVICGDQHGEKIIVLGNYAQLTFHSDSEVQEKGFLVSFTTVPKSEIKECGSVVNSTLKNPGYPGNYPSDMDCNYSVPIPRSMALKITFYEFDVECDSSCRYDYLMITNEKGRSFGKHCCGLYRTDVNVTGNYARLKFHSDAELETRGFLLFFSTVPLPECAFTVNNTLTSPGYPNKYPNNMDCNYSVPIPPGMAIKITFHGFDVEYSSFCKWDSLTITSDQREGSDKYCGKKKGMVVVLSGNYALLTFLTDYYIQAPGFMILFSFLPFELWGQTGLKNFRWMYF